MAQRKRKNRSRLERRDRKRTAAQGRVTETGGISATATLPMESQDGSPPVPTVPTAEQIGDSQVLQSAPHIRKPRNAIEKLQQAIDQLDSSQFEGIVTSVVADATTAQESPARTAAVNAFARIAKMCADFDSDDVEQPKGQETHVHGNVNIAADGIGADFIAIAAELGIKGEFLEATNGVAPVESSRPGIIDGAVEGRSG